MKKKTKIIIALTLLAAIIAFAVYVGISVYIGNKNNVVEQKITTADAQKIVDETFSSLPTSTALCSKNHINNTEITVTELEYGNKKNITLSCTYKTVDIYSVINENKNELLGIDPKKDNGRTKSATEVQVELTKHLTSLFDEAKPVSGKIDIELYEINGKLVLYLDDKVVNTSLGGLLDAIALIKNTNEIEVNGEIIDITANNTLRRGVTQGFELSNYDSEKPDTSIPIIRKFNSFKDEFYRNFIQKARWQYLTDGLTTTLAITALSLILGLAIGFIVAIIRTTYAKTGKLEIPDAICRLYVTIMRGTPVMIQLLIVYYVVLAPLGVEKFTAAILCFGINSGAYVSEIVRGGIMSVDQGQMEAGRSLGFNYISTMWYIILPQALKAVLPALANEFIALLKETSIAFYIGVADLTQGGLKIRSITYSNFMPLIAIAVIYLVLVLGLSRLVSMLERRMNKSDRS